MALSQTSSSRTISNLMRQQPVNLVSQDDMSVVAGATIERRTRINRPDDENTRCSVSNVRGQPKDFSQLTQPPTTLSTSNAISFLQRHTEPFVRRLRTCGTRQSRSFENIRDAEFSCSSFNNVTTPSASHFGTCPPCSGRSALPALCAI